MMNVGHNIIKRKKSLKRKPKLKTHLVAGKSRKKRITRKHKKFSGRGVCPGFGCVAGVDRPFSEWECKYFGYPAGTQYIEKPRPKYNH